MVAGLLVMDKTGCLKREHIAEPWAGETREKAWAKSGDPERGRKIAAAKRGKPRPPHVHEDLQQAKRAKTS